MKNILNSKILLSFLLIFSLTLVRCSKDEQIEMEKVVSPKVELKAAQTNITPDKPWYDIYGNIINAHGGGILYTSDGFYHWYGEQDNGWASEGIHCYRSRDLINWNDFGNVMPVDANNNNSDIRKGCIIQRPKVVYNSSTGKYVCLFKLYTDGTYTTCHIGVATATSPTGPFTYSNKFLGASTTGTGDFALYQSGADLYLIGVARGTTGRPDKYCKMNSDYKTPNSTGFSSMSGVTNSTEGLAIIKRGTTYHLFGSGSSGWDPNAARYFTSTSLGGPWTNQGNPCTGTNSVTGIGSNLTYGGQPTFIIPIAGVDNQYIAMMDVWKPGHLETSNYIWLPFRVNSTTNKLAISWVSSWNLTWFNNH